MNGASSLRGPVHVYFIYYIENFINIIAIISNSSQNKQASQLFSKLRCFFYYLR